MACKGPLRPPLRRSATHLEQHVLLAADRQLGAGVLGVHHAVPRLRKERCG